jgi:hypothetical protein
VAGGADAPVRAEENGWGLPRWLETRHGLGPRRSRDLIARHKIMVNDAVCIETTRRLQAGDRVVMIPETASVPKRRAVPCAFCIWMTTSLWWTNQLA